MLPGDILRETGQEVWMWLQKMKLCLSFSVLSNPFITRKKMLIGLVLLKVASLSSQFQGKVGLDFGV